MQPPYRAQRPKSRSGFSELEWEKVKAPFRHFYIDKNLTLKDAARQIAERYHFDATPRQWERRIAPEKWNFTKYTNRDDRLKQIQDSGKSLLEVSVRGRRKSTASDGRPTLVEDRNLRRFARREVSKKPRPRAKSVGTTSDTADEEMVDVSAAASPTPSDASTFTTEMGANTLSPTSESKGFDNDWMSTQNSQLTSPPTIYAEDLSQHSQSQTLPQITFSGPEDFPSLDMESDLTATSDSFQVNQAQAETYQRLYDTASQNAYSSTKDQHQGDVNNTTPQMAWAVIPSFDQAPSRAAQDLPVNGFDQLSFSTDMLVDDSQSDVNQNYPVIRLDALECDTAAQQLEESTTSDVYNPDNTYIDVHYVLDDHQSKVLEMLRGCIRGCESTMQHDTATSEIVLEHLKLFERGLRAQREYLISS